jgi:hypothetical protein
MLAELPDWFDLGFMRGLTVTTAVLLAVGVLAALVFLRTLRVRLVAAVLLAALAGGLIYYRAELEDCADTCSCKLLGSDLDTKGCPDDDADAARFYG